MTFPEWPDLPLRPEFQADHEHAMAALDEALDRRWRDSGVPLRVIDAAMRRAHDDTIWFSAGGTDPIALAARRAIITVALEEAERVWPHGHTAGAA